MGFVTPRGIGFIVAAVGLFVAGDVTGTGWVQIADAFLWGAVAVSAVVTVASGGTLGVRAHTRSMAGRERGATQGDEIRLMITVSNPRPWPRFGLTLRHRLSVNGADAAPLKVHIPFLPPMGLVAIDARFPTSRRGLHEMGAASVVADAPLGLFRRKAQIEVETSLLVLPAWASIEVPALRPAARGEIARPVTVRSGEEVAGSRPYAPGDPAREVHWRNTARTGRLVTKAYTASEAVAPILLYGVPREDESAGELLDDAVRVAAGVAREWGRRGMPMALDPSPEAVQPSWGEVLAILARATSENTPDVRVAVEQIPPGAVLGAVICAVDRDGIRALAAAAPRLGAVDVWLLASEDKTDDRQVQRGSRLLKEAGCAVEIVDLPLPAPAPVESDR